MTKLTTLILAVFITNLLHAGPIPVRQSQGTMHGFLQLRSASGELLGHGDLLQTAHGATVTTQLVLHFNDGSLNDETATYTQDRTFRLLTDHHIQKGPFFPKPLDLTVEANGQITTHTLDKTETQHLDLPPDIANGIIGPLLLNVPADTPPFQLDMVIPTAGKGRLIKLDVSPEPAQSFTVAGVPKKAAVFRLKLELGGVIGVLAPVVGKQPQDVQIWIAEGPAPELVRVVQQLYEGGPMVSIEMTGATFPHAAR